MIVLEMQLADRALTGGECEASSVPIKCVLNPDCSGSGSLMYLRDLSQFTKLLSLQLQTLVFYVDLLSWNC